MAYLLSCTCRPVMKYSLAPSVLLEHTSALSFAKCRVAGMLEAT